MQNRIEDENVVIKQAQHDRSNGWYVFKNPFSDCHSLCKYDLLEENNSSCLLHNLFYMDVIFIFIFNLLL